MRSWFTALRNPWRLMIVVDAVVMAGLFVYKVNYHNPGFQFFHLLVDYHFGFTKRALMGSLIGLLLPQVSIATVFVFGASAWLVALALFLTAFKRSFGFDEANLPLFAFTFGSPFFFKNFIETVGYFDIYGCILALVMLLLPARSIVYVIVAVVGCMLLLLMHHLHMLLYVPTVAVVVAMRYYLPRPPNYRDIAIGALGCIAIGVLFLLVVVYGSMPVPMDRLIAHMRDRMADKSYPIDPDMVEIWYRPISADIWSTWHVMSQNVLRIPVFLVLTLLHWPLIRYFSHLIDALAQPWHRRLTVLAIAAVTVGYVIIGVVVFDYSRWASSWAVCLILIMHAVKTLPARHVAAPIAADDTSTRILAWIVTGLPRVGISKPF